VWLGSASPMMRRTPSVVPRNAVPLVQDRHADGAQKSAYYIVGRKIVAYCQWRDTGALELEYALRDGVKHGKEYHFYASGRLLFEETYVRGQRHGLGRQWSEQGELLIQWRLVRGVGHCLWCDPQTGLLAEEHFRPPKRTYGYKRQWNADQRTVWQEYHFLLGRGYHGIWREWDGSGQLLSGFPRFFLRGRRVSKRHYLAACRTRRLLPPYCPEEDAPARALPAEYLVQRSRRDSRVVGE
jgi:hypothetical protein